MECLGKKISGISMFADKSSLSVDSKLHPYSILYTDETAYKYLYSRKMFGREQIPYPLESA